MGVESILEMYTLLWGWSQYVVLWDMLKHTGLAFLPFFGLVFNSLVSTLQSQDPGDASVASVKSIEISLVSALVIILVAVEPSVPLQMQDVEYVKICAHDSVEPDKTFQKTYKIQNGDPDTSSVYSRMTMQGFETVMIPPWWYAVLAFSNGVVRAGQEALPCVADLRTDIQQIQSVKISSPYVKQNLREFTKHCYQPAKKWYQQDARSGFPDHPENRQLFDKVKEVYHGQDLDWLGSTMLVHGKTYYENIQVRKENYDNTNFTFPTSCKEIWNHKTYGLRNRILIQLNHASGGAVTRVRAKVVQALNKHVYKKSVNVGLVGGPPVGALGAHAFAQQYLSLTEEQREDYVLYLVIKTHLGRNTVFHSPSDAIGTTTANGAIADGYSELALSIGIPYQKVKHFSMIDTIIKTIPISGALMVMIVILFLPFGLVFSSYSIQFLIIASIGLFSLKFFFYLWHVAWWLDMNFVHLLMFEQLQVNGQKGDIISMIASSMYIGFPILWGLIVTWAGFSINQFISGASAESAAKPAYQGGEQVLDMATRKAFKAATKQVENALKPKKDDDSNNQTEKAKEAQKQIDDLMKDKDSKALEIDDLKNEISTHKIERDQFEQELERAEQELERLRARCDNLSAKSELADKYMSDDDFYVPIPDVNSKKDK